MKKIQVSNRKLFYIYLEKKLLVCFFKKHNSSKKIFLLKLMGYLVKQNLLGVLIILNKKYSIS